MMMILQSMYWFCIIFIKINHFNIYLSIKKSGTTPRTPKFERKSSKNRSAIGSDEEIEDNISYVEENSKVKYFCFIKHSTIFKIFFQVR